MNLIMVNVDEDPEKYKKEGCQVSVARLDHLGLSKVVGKAA